jgi:hypothetical protein
MARAGDQVMRRWDIATLLIVVSLAVGSLSNDATRAQGVIVGICCAVLGIK